MNGFTTAPVIGAGAYYGLRAIGLGLALAILIDATLVRALIVPSAMRLMGKWNWWNPWTRPRDR